MSYDEVLHIPRTSPRINPQPDSESCWQAGLTSRKLPWLVIGFHRDQISARSKAHCGAWVKACKRGPTWLLAADGSGFQVQGFKALWWDRPKASNPEPHREWVFGHGHLRHAAAWTVTEARCSHHHATHTIIHAKPVLLRDLVQPSLCVQYVATGKQAGPFATCRTHEASVR